MGHKIIDGWKQNLGLPEDTLRKKINLPQIGTEKGWAKAHKDKRKASEMDPHIKIKEANGKRAKTEVPDLSNSTGKKKRKIGMITNDSDGSDDVTSNITKSNCNLNLNSNSELILVAFHKVQMLTLLKFQSHMMI